MKTPAFYDTFNWSWQCSFCQATFDSFSAAKLHEHRVHSEEAALAIQCMFRRYRARAETRAATLAANRAATRIQQWFQTRPTRYGYVVL